MKVIIQIPCYNEAETLPVALAELPRNLEGIDEVEWLIVDDGSSDETVNTAISAGVDYVVSHRRNMGLAKAFLTGLEACARLDADIIVNTDADNQYYAGDIQKLINPILSGKAEYVIGTRPINQIEEFSFLKKQLQKFGSWVVRVLSQTNIQDAPSGFRAISRSAALRLHVFNQYTYTLETVIQAGQSGIVTTCVPVKTNEQLRPSRLISSIPSYLQKSSTTILRSLATYRPFTFFVVPGVILLLIAILLGMRYLYFLFSGGGAGHLQSLILAVMLFVTGFSTITIGFLTDLIAINRKLIEDVEFQTKSLLFRLTQLQGDPESDFLTHGKLVYSRRKTEN
ncbi:MAG: glycosyltransferase family 2 protein [Anaerolineales bacterium]|nr:glycosyltransferase family 2 protein [Anaerolineales bacterium]